MEGERVRENDERHRKKRGLVLQVREYSRFVPQHDRGVCQQPLLQVLLVLLQGGNMTRMLISTYGLAAQDPEHPCSPECWIPIGKLPTYIPAGPRS